MPSSEGVPVDVVGRPSMGEGRTPVGAGAGGASTGTGDERDASPSAGARESAILRLRKAILECQGAGGGEVQEIMAAIDKESALDVTVHAFPECLSNSLPNFIRLL